MVARTQEMGAGNTVRDGNGIWCSSERWSLKMLCRIVDLKMLCKIVDNNKANQSL